jgi:hypothetical protein
MTGAGRSWMVVLSAMVAALSVAHAVPAGAQAGVLHVAPTGSGSACTSQAPCSLDTALAAARDGDEVVLAPGDYPRHAPLGIGRGIDLHGNYAAAAPTLTFDSVEGLSVSGAVHLDHLAVSAPSTALSVYGAGAVVESVKVSALGLFGNACYAVNATATIRDTTCWGSSIGLEAFVTAPSPEGSAGPRLTLRNVTVVGGEEGLWASTVAPGGVPFGTAVAGTLDVQNSIVRRTGSGSGTDLEVDTPEPDSSMTVRLASSSWEVLDTTQTPGATVSVTTTGQQRAAPVFVDAAHGDFHQAPASPTVDAGTPGADLGGSDIDLEPRAVGATDGCPGVPDIGADELVPAHACPGAHGRTWYAAIDGAGTDCSEPHPCTLRRAVTDPALRDGDTVVVGPAHYALADLTVERAVTLEGQATQRVPTITFSGAGLEVTADAVVQDLHLVSTAESTATITANGASPTLQRLDVSASGAGSTACQLHDSQALLRDSVCWAGGESGRGVLASFDGAPGTFTPRLRNVTAVASYALASIVNSPGISATVDAGNVVAHGSAIDLETADLAGSSVVVELAHSDYRTHEESARPGGLARVTEPGTGTNIVAPAVFEDAEHGDFHETATSPTVDAGMLDGATGTTDDEGDPRSVHVLGPCDRARPDIGADELTPGVTCPPGTTAPPGPVPDTRITSAVKRIRTPHRLARVRVAFTSDGPADGFECALDTTRFAACTSPFVRRLPAGRHRLHVRAVGASGAVDPTPAALTFTVRHRRVPRVTGRLTRSAVWYAAPAGAGTACTGTDPCSLDTALNGPEVLDGDEVVLAAGTYSRSASLFVHHAVDLHGPLGGGAVLRLGAAGDANVMRVLAAARLHDLRIEGGRQALAVDAAGAVVERVEAAVGRFGIACQIDEGSVVLSDSLCRSPDYVGLRVSADGPAVVLRNDTLVGHPALLAVGSVDVAASNVVAWSEGAFSVDTEGTGTVMLTSSNYIGPEPGHPDIPHTDPAPHFVDAAAGDFRERADSPTIDAGLADATADGGARDLDGRPRSVRAVDGCAGRPDIGAYELWPSAVCPSVPTVVPSAPETRVVSVFPKRVRGPGRHERVRLVFTASTPATFRCSVDGSAYAPCRSPWRPRLSPGPHRFLVDAVSPSGVADPTPVVVTVRLRSPKSTRGRPARG